MANTNLGITKKLDRENMMSLLMDFPKQCLDALKIAEKAKIKASYKRKYSQIIFTGLGGSAIGADIVKGLISDEIDVPIIVNRRYTLPNFAGKDSLIFVVSYSGNTEETLSAYKEAKKKKAKVIAITSGGKLKELALKNNDSFITIPEGYPPRCALAYSFIPALTTLSRLGFIKSRKKEIQSMAKLLSNLQKNKLNPGLRGKANISKTIAEKIYGQIPFIYASETMASVATRWRGQFAENSKTLSSMHVLPEMNHNEIVGWVNPRNLLKKSVAIILRDKDDHSRVRVRMNITASILRKEGFKVLVFDSIGKSLLERTLSLCYIGDFASFYLAILSEIDPTPVDRITYLKNQLKKA